MADQAHPVDGGPVTPRARRSSGTSVVTNPYRGDQDRYPAAPYVTYAGKNQGSGVEEIDNSCVVYVGGLTGMIDDRILYDTFRQFGSIVSLVRRSVNFDVRPNSAMTQYAFVGFSSAQDAQNAIQTGEITLDNRKLIIKPRDKPGVSYHKHISHGVHNPQTYKGFKDKRRDESRDQILQLLHKNSRGAQPVPQIPVTYDEQQHMQQAQSQQHGYKVQQQTQQYEQQVATQPPPASRDPTAYYDGGVNAPTAKTSNTGQAPVLMSKALNVANVPIDMSPKELFTMFSEVGLVEGCYIFPFADPMNRRFGHIVMASFYCAQKACETYDGFVIRGCALDVTYRNNTEPDTDPTSSPVTPYSFPYQPIQHMQQPMQHHFPHQYQQQFQHPNFPGPIYHQAFQHQLQPQQVTWLPQPYGPTPPGLISPTGIIPFAHQFPQYQNMVPFGAYNPMGQPGFEAQHHSSVSPTNSQQNYPNTNPGWQGQVQTPDKSYQNGRPYGPRRQHGRTNGRGFLSNRPPTHLPGGEPHIRSASDSSSTTLVSSGYEQTKFQGPVVVNGSYAGSPVIVNGSYAGSCETPSRHSTNGDTSSDKASTPSPVIVRPVPDPQSTPETPTKSPSHTSFEVLTASVIPETTDPADPANLYIKNLDDAVISDAEDLKLLFVPYGPVASSFLSTYPGSGISRGYGFVAFVKPEDAAAAKAKMNGTMVGKKRVFISYAERKEDRTQRLKDLFGGDKGEVNKGKDQKEKKSAEDIQENSSDEAPGNIDVGGHLEERRTVFGANNVANVLSFGEIPDVNVEDSTEATEPHVEEVAMVLGNDIPPIIAEQVIAVTTRWRGTQLTGIAEVVEDEDLTRIAELQDNFSSPSYVAPSIVNSPTYDLQETMENLRASQALFDSLRSMVPEQQSSPVSSPNKTSSDTSVDGNQQNRNINSFPKQGGQIHQQYANHSSNRSFGDHGNSRGGYGQHKNHGYYQGNGNSSGSGRSYHRNNNPGSYGGTKSMLPVPRNSGGVIQIAPIPIAPTGPRIPYFNNGGQQQFYPSYPNNEPIGQNYQGRKNNKKNPGRGRSRDSNPFTHQARVQNTQPNGGIVGKVEMTAGAF